MRKSSTEGCAARNGPEDQYEAISHAVHVRSFSTTGSKSARSKRGSAPASASERNASLPLFDQREETLRFHPDSCLTESVRSTRRRTFMLLSLRGCFRGCRRMKGADGRPACEHVESGARDKSRCAIVRHFCTKSAAIPSSEQLAEPRVLLAARSVAANRTNPFSGGVTDQRRASAPCRSCHRVCHEAFLAGHMMRSAAYGRSSVRM